MRGFDRSSGRGRPLRDDERLVIRARPAGTMGDDARVHEIVDRGRCERRDVEPAQQALEPAVAEGLAVRVLRFDHAIRIPDQQIAGS